MMSYAHHRTGEYIVSRYSPSKKLKIAKKGKIERKKLLLNFIFKLFDPFLYSFGFFFERFFVLREHLYLLSARREAPLDRHPHSIKTPPLIFQNYV
jgi:hypothetical protein